MLKYKLCKVVDPSKKVPDLNCDVQDLLLEVVDLKQEVPDGSNLTSAGHCCVGWQWSLSRRVAVTSPRSIADRSRPRPKNGSRTNGAEPRVDELYLC